MSLCWDITSMYKKTFVFPKLNLRPEVQEYLGNVFKNKELVAGVGQEEAESMFEELLYHLSHPPSFTCVRVSTHLAPLDTIRERLVEELRQMSGFDGGDIPILSHTHVPDVLLLPVIGPRPALPQSDEVIVGAQCGNAVLRGAHVFAPGILSAPKYMKAGDRVSVFSDLEGKCTRGAKDFQGKKVFVGNGVAEMGRSDIFCSGEPVKGVGIRMEEPVYLSPSFDNLLPSLVFLQNLPSVVVGHVLGPRPGERILDMCAAPGGKTSHIAALMKGQGEVIALDRIRGKVMRIRQNAQVLQLDCIKAYCFNSIQAVRTEHAQNPDDGPPFPAESFDRVLLDAPCSGLGQRPNMACAWSLREITSYPPLQRKLFHAAVRLLKRGGVLVYSTCTVTLAENEEQVAWALNTFPYLTLQPQEPHIGGQGMLGAGLSHDQLRLLQRFSPVRGQSGGTRGCDPDPDALHLTVAAETEPARLLQRANSDTIGFFIAKFLKT
ncbi:hypothetical protein AAFF_G00006840 [Aldrovandia affinis]|uniref:SAM-dependent MTase RsmB/NOP-type domain-containing protein n=1 Tax=Aldrovandia affinis TaxID=143900 RepID=A0AAD7TE53_9TELE|nr:hypothetical protein AAFF_G00006840 [Aldrovandia affinis]